MLSFLSFCSLAISFMLRAGLARGWNEVPDLSSTPDRSSQRRYECDYKCYSERIQTETRSSIPIEINCDELLYEKCVLLFTKVKERLTSDDKCGNAIANCGDSYGRFSDGCAVPQSLTSYRGIQSTVSFPERAFGL